MLVSLAYPPSVHGLASRSYTNIKVSLMANGVSQYTLAAMDSGFMFTYACGSFVTGMLGDRFSPVAVIAGGLFGSTACLLLIAYGASTSIISNAALCGAWFLTWQLIHGLFQATGGPVNTAVMGSWFPAKGRGLIFGLWTCHQYIGDLTAALFSAYILRSGYDWRLCIIVPAIVNGLWGVVNVVSVPSRPEDAGIVTESSSGKAGNTEESALLSSSSKAEPIGFLQAACLPNVANYAFAFGFFKLVNYAMFFQLPLILTMAYSPSTANIISSFYSIGMMPGGIVCGWASDLLGGRRACVIALFMALLCPLLLLFAWYMDTIPASLLFPLLIFMGCLVGGPNNIITSAVAADLADDPSIRGNNRALGTVTGIINGSGSVTAALGQMLIPILADWGKADNVGYRYVWYLLIVCTIVGTGLMHGRIMKELYPGSLEERTPLASSNPSRGQYSAIPLSEPRTHA